MSRLVSHRLRALLALAAVAIVTLVGMRGTVAAMSSQTGSDANSLSAGTVALDDNATGVVMFDLSGLKPNDTESACIKVVSKGSLPSSVTLYGSTGGSGLDRYLSITITRGSFSSEPGPRSCTGFVPDSTVHIPGQPQGVIWMAPLDLFPKTYAASAVLDPVFWAPETWTQDEGHVYKIQLTVGDNSAAAGKNVTQTFTWEARNL